MYFVARMTHSLGLMLRSAAQRRVSKHGPPSSFETGARAPSSG